MADADKMADIATIIPIIEEIAKSPSNYSSIFINNLNKLCRVSKGDFIKAFTPVNSKTINTLREQIFFIFLDSFETETLVQDGFLITDEDEPKNHLKKRFKHENAINDIYNMGLSILEDS